MNIKGIGKQEGSPIVKVAAFIIVVAGMIYAKSIITPFLLALFISIICVQPVAWLEKKHVPRWIALLSVILGMVLLFSGFAYVIGGTLSSFSGNVPKYESTLNSISASFFHFLNSHGLAIPEGQLSNFIQPARVLELTAAMVNELLNMMGNTFLIFLIILFILMEFGSFQVKARAILSGSDDSLSYFATITQNIRHYLWIKTLVCIATGVLIYFALLVLGVDYPLLWALIAALMNYIPNIGSIIAAFTAVLFALVQLGIGGALWTLGSFLVVNNVLGNLVEPRIMGKGLGLSTLVVFLSLLFWGFILGTVGMFLSVPLTMTIKIIMEQNENTRWLAVLLGTPDEAKKYLVQKELTEPQHPQ